MTNSATAVGQSGTDHIDTLLYGTQWGTTTGQALVLTYSFATSAGAVGYSLDGSYFSAFDSNAQAAFEAILQAFARVSGLTFSEVADPADADIAAYWYTHPDNWTARVVDFPGNTAEAGDIQLGSLINAADLTSPGTYSYFTLLHELGHALGLKHPHDTVNGNPADASIPIESSVMSYLSYFGGSLGGYSLATGSYPTALMINDIAAIQYLYGANWSHNSGDTVYTFDPGADVIFGAYWDGGGTDTYNFASYTTDLKVDLRPGAWSDLGGQYAILETLDASIRPSGNIANPYLYQNDLRSLIENATGGAGDDVLIGNVAANILTGGGGHDRLQGGGGADHLNGGAGDDIYVLEDGNDTIDDSSGTDTVTSTVTRSLADYATMEHLILLGSGHIGGTGNDLDNSITGNAGNNLLYGGAGLDTLDGGAGNDTYALGADADIVIDGSGIDTITSTISRSLLDHADIERLTLLGAADADATGNERDNILIGNTGRNTITAGAGNDRLEGGGGLDHLDGGDGDDIYVLADGKDTIADSAGVDTVTSTVARSLGGLAMIENLMLLGSAHLNGTGNALDNTITGNVGNNVLNGGAGLDRLVGGAGNDTYVLGAERDSVVDSAGIDTITSTISRSLAGYAGVERLTLVGAGNINASGNALDNLLTGNAGNNVLNGAAGADRLVGGAGNDTYVLSNGGDSVVDSAGIDTITSTISRSLAGYAGVERLTLVGASNINASGNALDNLLTGNAGNNVLNGAAGADRLVGGAGNDTYVLGAERDSVVDSAGIDTITSTISRSLAGYAGVERLTLVGASNINASGNALDNLLTGNAGNNVLNGAAGADRLVGGAGNDTYVLSNGGDSVVDSAGIDTITSTISRSLANYGAVERLALLGGADVNGFGNGLSNLINGNAGRNTLKGGNGNDTINGGAGADRLYGNAGKDVLTGGGGADIFVFDAAPNAATNVDRIHDFSVADDTIWLDDAAFAALGALGRLAASAFASNLTGLAQDAQDRLIYERDTGELYYDRNGIGAGGGTLVAVLTANLALTHQDFVVV